MGVKAARMRATTSLAGIRAGGATCQAFPGACSNAQWLCWKLNQGIRPLTVAGAAQVRLGVERIPLLLPVELRHVNHTASTNNRILRETGGAKPYNA